VTADEYRSRFPKTHTLEVAPGLTFKVRRVSKTGMLAQGLIPSFYVNEVGRQWRRAQAAAEAEDSSLDQRDLAKLILAVVCEACIEPRLVQGEPQEGELNVFEDLEDEHLTKIFNWAMTGGRGEPIRTERGEVAVDDLLSFHAPGAGGATDAAGANSADVRAEALRDARAIG
jgi:hypothetical protein